MPTGYATSSGPIILMGRGLRVVAGVGGTNYAVLSGRAPCDTIKTCLIVLRGDIALSGCYNRFVVKGRWFTATFKLYPGPGLDNVPLVVCGSDSHCIHHESIEIDPYSFRVVPGQLAEYYYALVLHVYSYGYRVRSVGSSGVYYTPTIVSRESVVILPVHNPPYPRYGIEAYGYTSAVVYGVTSGATGLAVVRFECVDGVIESAVPAVIVRVDATKLASKASETLSVTIIEGAVDIGAEVYSKGLQATLTAVHGHGGNSTSS